jgi:hypothetical protein
VLGEASALAFSPVSAIAPAREISILIGAAMGVRLLGEGDMGRRLTAASVRVLGVVALPWASRSHGARACHALV